MHCPVCKADTLAITKLEDQLSVYCCQQCSGTWIPSDSYWSWREQQAEELAPVEPPRPAPERPEPETAKICPSCQHLLLPYGVGHGIAFQLDHCGNCNGVWCDGGEWEIIRASNLHDNLHQIFGVGWQRQVRAEGQRERIAAIYSERFGAADYEELQRIRRWLDEHPQRSAMIAYLNNPDPYKR